MHNRFSIIVNHLVAHVHLVDDALGSSIISGRHSAYVEVLHLTVAQSHSEVGVAIVRHIHLHSNLSITEIAFLLLDIRRDSTVFLYYVVVYILDRHTVFNARIILVSLLVEENLLAALHQDRLAVEILNVFRVVATKLLVDFHVDSRQVFSVNMFAVILQQSSHNLFVESSIPFRTVVVENHILLLRLVFRSLHFHAVKSLQGTGVEFRSASEGFNPVGECIFRVEALGIKVLHLLEVEFAFKESRTVLISLYTRFKLLLLSDDANRVDTLVHSDGIFPVVRTLCVFRVVFDAYSLIGTHVALHNLLFYATHLSSRLIIGIAAFLNAVRRKIAARGTRISHSHGKVALLVSVERNTSPVFRMIRHVVFRVFSRSVGLRVGIDAEHRVVAGLSRPHPVVGLASELTHRLRYGKYKSEVVKVAVSSGKELVSLVVRLNLEAQCRVFLLHILRHYVLDGVEEHVLLVDRQIVETFLAQFVGNILLFHHKANEHVLVRQFLFIRLGIEAVQHIVVVNGRMGTDSFESAVVVSKHESVWRHDDSGAESREVYHRLHYGIVATVQSVV